MYAIIATGGKQYKVVVGQRLKVEKLDLEVGATVELKALLIADENSVVAGNDADKSVVKAEIVFNGRGKKLNMFTYKPKKNVRRRKGHRQPYTEILIKEIA